MLTPETTAKMRAVVTPTQNPVLLFLGSAGFLVALGLGAHMVLEQHGGKFEWLFLLCVGVASLGCLKDDWVLKVIDRLTPWSPRGKDK